MMYDVSDPRSALSSPIAKPMRERFAGAECGRFYEAPPQEDDVNGRSWFIRSQNCLIAYTDAADGACLKRSTQSDEYVLLLPQEGVSATIATANGEVAVPGFSIAFIPAGMSEVRLSGSGLAIRLFTTSASDLTAKCVNADSYRTPNPYVTPFRPWPDAKDGHRVHAYSLDVPDEPGRFGRIWRGSTIMVNFLPAQIGPRDVTKLSPHHHDDFEQMSLALEGAFTHHLRWPWTTNLNNWRDDQHEYCASPSAMVIPPPAIHTSRGMLDTTNQLVDIFSPPRRDFCEKPGWVLNAADYQMPKLGSADD